MHGKKLFRKCASLVMAAVLGLSSVMPAFAEEVPVTETVSAGYGAEAESLDTVNPNQEDSPVEEQEEIGKYSVFIPENKGVAFSLDPEKNTGEVIDGYSVLLYDAGEEVIIGAEVPEGFDVFAFDEEALQVDMSFEGGKYSFTMPGSDVILDVREAVLENNKEEMPGSTEDPGQGVDAGLGETPGSEEPAEDIDPAEGQATDKSEMHEETEAGIDNDGTASEDTSGIPEDGTEEAVPPESEEDAAVGSGNSVEEKDEASTENTSLENAREYYITIPEKEGMFLQYSENRVAETLEDENAVVLSYYAGEMVEISAAAENTEFYFADTDSFSDMGYEFEDGTAVFDMPEEDLILECRESEAQAETGMQEVQDKASYTVSFMEDPLVEFQSDGTEYKPGETVSFSVTYGSLTSISQVYVQYKDFENTGLGVNRIENWKVGSDTDNEEMPVIENEEAGITEETIEEGQEVEIPLVTDFYEFIMPEGDVTVSAGYETGIELMAGEEDDLEDLIDDEEAVPNKFKLLIGGAYSLKGSSYGTGSAASTIKKVSYSIDGKTISRWAFCIQPKATTPSKGHKYDLDGLKEYDDGSLMSKGLYYLFGGPAWGNSITYADGSGSVNLKEKIKNGGASSKSHFYTFTHYILAYIYMKGSNWNYNSSDANVVNAKGEKMIKAVKAELEKLPEAGASISKRSLSTSSVALTANNTTKVSESVVYSAAKENTATITLPEGVILVNESNGNSPHSGTVSINGGTTFHLEAVSGVTGSQVYTFNCKFAPAFHGYKLVLSGYQDIGFSYFSDDTGLSFEVVWPSNGYCTLYKVSTSNVDGNGHYSLAGATYQVSTNGNFTDTVGTLVTNEAGVSNTIEVVPGTYYVREIISPKGFKMDSTIYPVTVADGQSVPIYVSDEPFMDGEVHLEKFVEEGTVNDGTSNKPREGIQFSLTMKEGNDEFPNPFVTDKDGKIDITGLKYGTYTLTELDTVNEYHLLSEPVTFTLDEKNKTKDLTKESGSPVINKYSTPRGFVIEKRDKETGELIKGRTAKFQILDQDGIPVKLYVSNVNKKTDVFSMDENGIIQFDSNCGIFGGKYTLVEIECPKGYQKAPDVDFEITAEDDQKVVTVTMKDEAIKGSLSVTKIDHDTGLNCGAGFTFQVVSVDAKKDPAGNIYNGFGENEVCATITTDENGIASTGDILYTGKYYVQEVQSADGHAVNMTKYPFEIVSDDKTPEDAIDVEIQIKNHMTELRIIKVDEYDQEEPLEGITFRVKPLNTDDSDGQLYTTDKGGKISVTGLMHSTTYTVQEVSTIPGYNLDAAIHTFSVDSNGLVSLDNQDENPCTISASVIPEDWGEDVNAEDGKGYCIEYRLSNRPNRISVSKSDVTNGEELPGAHLKITRISSDNDEEKSEVVEEWVSTKEPHLIYGLPAGTYRLTEVLVPDLYEVAESVVFTVKDDMEIQKVQMKDSPYRDVEVSKTGITDGKEIKDARLQILDAENKVVEEWTSGQDGTAENGDLLPHMVKLHSGVYTLVETKPADGYVTAESIVFTVKQRDKAGDVEIQKVHMEDDITKLSVSKKDITNGEEIPGAHLIIKDEKGETRYEWTSTTEPHYIEMIPIGNYTLTEITAPNGYEVAETVSFEVKDTGEIQHVEMFDSPFRTVYISKTDITGGQEIEGAHLEITDKDGNVVDEWVSTEEGPHLVEYHYQDGSIASGLPSGTYTLTETLPADGYVTAEAIEFTVVQTSDTDYEIQTVQMFDDVTKVEISKQDVTTEKELPGAKLVIKDMDGKIVEEWTSSNEPHYIEMLPIGDYTLTETTAPDGYDVAETVKFTIKDTPEIQHVVMYDAPTPKNSTPQTGDSFPFAKAVAIAGGIVVLLGAGFLLIRRRKKK